VGSRRLYGMPDGSVAAQADQLHITRSTNSIVRRSCLCHL
jgi:hypothetical protein